MRTWGIRHDAKIRAVKENDISHPESLFAYFRILVLRPIAPADSQTARPHRSRCRHHAIFRWCCHAHGRGCRAPASEPWVRRCVCTRQWRLSGRAYPSRVPSRLYLSLAVDMHRCYRGIYRLPCRWPRGRRATLATDITTCGR